MMEVLYTRTRSQGGNIMRESIDNRRRAVRDVYIANKIIRAFYALPEREKPYLIAIDGRCAAGKTALAMHLSRMIGCPVIHMDHFFLRPEQRKEEENRFRIPGGNVDYERFIMEIMFPLKLRPGSPFKYNPFNYKKQELAPPVYIQPTSAVIVEGSYSCHPTVWDHYDMRIFLTVGRREQEKRIRQRRGEEAVAMYREKWIPLEEEYFAAEKLAKRCDFRFWT